MPDDSTVTAIGINSNGVTVNVGGLSQISVNLRSMSVEDILNVLREMTGRDGYAVSETAWSTWDALSASECETVNARLREATRRMITENAARQRESGAA